ncbi:MAG: helix-turn-helix transcriptional regulator [Candidatus Hodarchaeales archaeon]|jgi:DNA-binding Lrp family transcriptional regulator
MVVIEEELKEISKFEPLLMQLLEPRINEQEARILSLIFRNGGYIPLNSISQRIGIAQPTVSNRVKDLTNKGFLRKNEELMPIVLVLLINCDKLKEYLESKKLSLKNAVLFLEKSKELVKDLKIQEMTERALNHLFPEDNIMSKIILEISKNKIISRDVLYSNIFVGEKIDQKTKEKVDLLIQNNNDFIQTVYKKFQKKEMFFCMKIPIGSIIEIRTLHLNKTYNYYFALLDELKDFMKQDYDSLLPIQLLQFPSDLKLRIDICLKKYQNISVLLNSINRKIGKDSNILDFLTESKEFNKDHSIKILSSKKTELKSNLKTTQIKFKELTSKLSRDYSVRDIILFDNHGCIVIPPSNQSFPYYNISPRFIKSVTNIFKENWK